MKEGTDMTQAVWAYYMGLRWANPHFDPEKAAEIEVVHIEDAHIYAGLMQARTVERTTTEWGARKAKKSVTRWGDGTPGPDLSAGASALRLALIGEWDG